MARLGAFRWVAPAAMSSSDNFYLRWGVRRSLIVAMCACVSVLGRLGAQQSRVIPITGVFAPMQLVPTVTVPEATISATRITDLAVSPTGIIVINDDWKQLVAFSPDGRRRFGVGGPGQGPGEYRGHGRTLKLGWLADTLVVKDEMARRASLFSLADGRFLASIPSAVRGDILSAGQRAFVVAPEITHDTVRVVPPDSRLKEVFHSYPVYEFGLVSMTTAGFGKMESAIRDRLQPQLAPECVLSGGYLSPTEPPFPDHGPRRAVTSTGAMVTAHPDSFRLTVRATESPPTDLVRSPWEYVSVTGTLWDSVVRIARAEVAAVGTPLIGCGPGSERPKFAPVIRAIATDEQDRLWVETTARTGSTMLLLSLDGKAIGSFVLPARDESVPWVIRNDRLYLVTKDRDDLQAIQVFDIRP